MKRRRLRIAWSVAWGIVAVLLCVFWVRSYKTWDRFFWQVKNYSGVQLNSDLGHAVLVVGPRIPSSQAYCLKVSHLPIMSDGNTFSDDVFGFRFDRTIHGLRIDVPSWFMFLIGLVTATAPWTGQLRWRF